VHVVVDSQATMKAALEGGEVRAIATSGGRRSPFLPDVPTVQEGGVPGYDVTSWNALFAPKGAPAAVVTRLASETRAVLALPDVKARLADLGIEATPETPETLGERLRADVARWRGVIEQAGIPRQ
jgi:tripartite-type tricarboxylate transporter receptor subunit TctC